MTMVHIPPPSTPVPKLVTSVIGYRVGNGGIGDSLHMSRFAQQNIAAKNSTSKALKKQNEMIATIVNHARIFGYWHNYYSQTVLYKQISDYIRAYGLADYKKNVLPTLKKIDTLITPHNLPRWIYEGSK